MAGVQKVLAKLEASMQGGSYYEAHEMCKTVYHRYRSKGQREESYQLAEEGAKLQLAQGQLHCGVELCMMLAEAYEADAAEPQPAAVQRVLNLIAAFPTEARTPGEDPPVDECTKFVGAATKWLKRVEGQQQIPAVEGRLAAYIRAALGWQGLGRAMQHYARAADPAAFAAALAEAASHGGPGEEDLFLARGALSVAAAAPSWQQLDAAGELLEAYASATGRPLPDTPLMHFVQLYLEALARQSEQLTQLLLARYTGSLDRDPGLWQLAVRCREAHLGLAPAGGLGSLLGSLLQPAAG